jgi:hypothetical protein
MLMTSKTLRTAPSPPADQHLSICSCALLCAVALSVYLREINVESKVKLSCYRHADAKGERDHHRRNDNTKIDLTKVACKMLNGLSSTGPNCGSCKHGNEHFGFRKCKEFLD